MLCTCHKYLPAWWIALVGAPQITTRLPPLTLTLLVAYLANTKWCKNPENWLKPLQMGTHLRGLSESFQMNTNMIEFRRFSQNVCILVLWAKVASASEGLKLYLEYARAMHVSEMTPWWIASCLQFPETSIVRT